MSIEGRISTIQVLLTQISHCFSVINSRPLEHQDKQAMKKVLRDMCNDIKDEATGLKQEINQL